MPMKVSTYLKRNIRWGAMHFTLLDPENLDGPRAAAVARAAETAGSHAILVGGSTGATRARVDPIVKAVKDVVGIPVILFPGGADGLSGEADAVLFMMMLNSTDPRFLVGEQLAAVEALDATGLETIPMGYVVVAPGGRVGQVGRAALVPRDDAPSAVRYALLARHFGMQYVYLEAGSGAVEPVPEAMIEAVHRRARIPLIVGGGIRDAATARRVVDAGADIFVTGNLLEGDVDVQKTLRSILRDSVDELRSRFRHSG